jgi:hypothetical protein
MSAALQTEVGGWRLLRDRSFAVYWSSGLVSNIGTWLHNVTAGVLMLKLTGSAFMVGLVSVATFLPMLLFSLPAGALSDRHDRRRIVVLTQSCSLLVGIVLSVAAASGHLGATGLLSACFVIGTAYSVAKPALSAMLPALVPSEALVGATAFNTLQFNLGQVVGPALATVVLLVATPAWAFGLNSVTFAVQIVAVCLLPSAVRGTRLAAGASRATSGIRHGLRYIRATPPMPSVLVAVVLCNGAVETLRTLAPSVATELMHRPGALAGTVILGYSVGTIVTVFALTWLRRMIPAGFVVALAFLLQAGGALGIMAAGSDLVVVVGSAASIGVGFAIIVPVLSGRLQQLSSDEFRGRVLSTFAMAHLGSRPLFAVVAGASASVFGVRAAFASTVVVALGAAAFSWMHRLGAVPSTGLRA